MRTMLIREYFLRQLLGISSVLIVVFTASVILYSVFTSLTFYKNTNLLVVDSIAGNLSSSLVFEDKEDAYKVLANLEKRNDFKGYRVLLRDKATFLESGKIANVSFEKNEEYKLTSEYLIIKSDVISSDKVLGYLVVSFSVSPIKMELIYIVIISLIVALLLFFITFLAIKRTIHSVSSPLHKISETISVIIRNNDLNNRVEISRENQIKELQDLASYFNKLLGNLDTNNSMLKEQIIKAQEALKVRTQFLNNMSHEIRTPMNAIVGMADLLDETELSVKQREMVSIFKGACTSLLTIINDILDLSKIETGQFTLKNRPFDLRKMLVEIHDFMRIEASKKGLEFELRIDKELEQFLIGDGDRIKQITLNLLSNSLKFTKKGVVRLSLDSLSKDNSTQRIRVSVYDTGIGIEQEKVDLIFEEFNQVDPSITREFGGTGLGLSISSKLLTYMNSKMTVESIYGKCSLFSFELELEITKEEVVEEVVTTSKVERGKRKVLVVDDSSDNIMIIKTHLKSLDLEIDTAENGEEAVNLVKVNDDYDLILMDMSMPIMDGYEATSTIRKLEEEGRLKENRVIALTAYAMVEDVEKCLNAGCDKHLAKPIRKKDLLKMLDSELYS